MYAKHSREAALRTQDNTDSNTLIAFLVFIKMINLIKRVRRFSVRPRPKKHPITLTNPDWCLMMDLSGTIQHQTFRIAA